MSIEKSTLNVGGKFPTSTLKDGSAEAHKGGTHGSLAGYNQTWGTNPWRNTHSEPEGKPDMFSGDLPDTGPEPSERRVSASDLNQGYQLVDNERTPLLSRDDTGEEPVGDPFSYGGFLARPRGTAR